MPINSIEKSSRFLQSRRYTHDTLTDAQEAFTSVLDINASEIYTDQNLIPSSGLPFSGSGQNGSIYAVGGQNVMKYWYRQPMTKSNLNNEVWFFLNPTGSSAGIGAQLIDSNQQTNFISPKYSVSSLTNANTEDATPGYGVKVLIDGVQQSVNNYSFDYKTGVLEFVSASLAPTGSQVVYISAYQYVGRTLLSYNTGSFTGSFSGSFVGGFYGTSSWATNAVTASYLDPAGVAKLNLFQITTGSISASVSTDPNNLFLIKSGSSTFVNIQNNSNTTVYSNLFIIKNFTTQQPVMTVSQSIVQFATSSTDPIGPTQAGSIFFTSSSFYVGLE